MRCSKTAFALCVGALACLVNCAQRVTPEHVETGFATLPAEFCYADDVVPLLRTDLKYAGNDNFVGRPIAGYVGKRPILRRDAAMALRQAAAELRPLGYGLIIWDAYRPARAMSDFRAWSRTPDDSTRASFYPRTTKQGIYASHYIGDISEHSWGIAVDISLYHLANGQLVDMGGDTICSTPPLPLIRQRSPLPSEPTDTCCAMPCDAPVSKITPKNGGIIA